MRAYCDCCDLPVYSCSKASAEAREAAVAVARQHPQPEPPTPARERVVHSSDLSTRSRRAWTPIPRNHDYPALCVNERCRRPNDDGAPNPRQTEGRSNLCPTCEDRSRDNLTAIADAWPDLEAALFDTHAGGDQVRGTPSRGLQVDEATHQAMQEIEGTLAFYGRLVSRERGAVWPLGEPTVPELARWLARTHLPWLAAHPDPGISEGLTGDVHRAARLARRFAYESRPRRIQLPFRCREDVPVRPEVEDSPTHACGALMHTTLHPDRDDLPDLVCEHGHTVPPSVWMRGTWRQAPIDTAALTSLVRAITAHTAHTSETGARQ